MKVNNITMSRKWNLGNFETCDASINVAVEKDASKDDIKETIYEAEEILIHALKVASESKPR
jgi:hypothetical protein